MKFLIQAILVILAAAVSTTSMAQSFGISAGKADVEGVDDTSFSLSGQIGINENLSFEIAYNDFGGTEGWIYFNGSNEYISVEASSIDFAFVASTKVSDSVSLFGKLGFAMWDIDVSSTIGSGSVDGTDLTFGLGALIHIQEGINAELKWQRYDVEVVNGIGADLDNMSIGLRIDL